MVKKHTWSLGSDEAKTYLQNLLENIPDAIYFKDRESRFLLLNKACMEKHGFVSLEETIGKSDADVFTKKHAEEALHDEQKILESGEPIVGIEEMETWPNGSVTWVSTTKMPLKDPEGDVVGTFGISRDITDKKEADLLAAEYAAEIERLKDAMEDDVRMAGELQKAFFPKRYPVFPPDAAPEDSSLKISHFNKASGIVGGDLCSIKSISATEAGIFLCDVMGHGVRAALGTAIIRSLIEELSPTETDPGQFLTHLNDRIFPIFRQSQDLMFITAIYLIIDTSTGKVRFASAGHPVPLHQSNSPDSSKNSVTGSEDPALALFDDCQFQTLEHSLSPGDTLLVYTDGTYEACNADNEEYGLDRMKKIMEGNSNGSLQKMIQAILTDIRTYSGQDSFDDDVCMIGLKWDGPPA